MREAASIGSWPLVTIEDVALDVTVGHVGPMADQYLEAGVPFLRSLSVEPFGIKTEGLKFISPEFHRKLKKSALVPGDVVIVRTGKPGTCAVIPDWLATVNCSDLVIVRCGPRVRPHFLCYIVNSIAGHHIDSHTVGAVQQHFNVGSARTLSFFLPPIEEQDRILMLLRGLDSKIELNRRMNETLEAMARALFRDWFVDFGPTRAKMAGTAPYLSDDLWPLFPDRLDANGKPEGWEAQSIGAHVDTQKGLSYKGAGLTTEGEGTPLHNLNSILEGGGYKDHGLKFYSGDFKQRHIIGPGDLIVANTEQGFDHLLIGFSALVPKWVGDKGLFSHHLFKLEPRKTSPLSRVWLHLAISSSPLGEAIRRFSNGTTVNMLPAAAFEIPKVFVPPAKLLQCFDRLIAPILDKQEQAIQVSRTLAQTRDLLLPRLMSGELRVAEAAETLEAAL